MPSTIDSYRNLIEQPFGRIFYDIVYSQLNVTGGSKRILDFGAGFCVTANHYASEHEVVAYEPNQEMINRMIPSNPFTLITDFNSITQLASEQFDLILCHNVLEYAINIDDILSELIRLLKPSGTLSIIKHNRYGRILASAVFSDSPATALSEFSNECGDSMFGIRREYSNEWLISQMSERGLAHFSTQGIRAFYGLSSNNDIKYTDEWYENMLLLEQKCADMDEFKSIAFFHHLKFIK